MISTLDFYNLSLAAGEKPVKFTKDCINNQVRSTARNTWLASKHMKTKSSTEPSSADESRIPTQDWINHYKHVIHKCMNLAKSTSPGKLKSSASSTELGQQTARVASCINDDFAAIISSNDLANIGESDAFSQISTAAASSSKSTHDSAKMVSKALIISRYGDDIEKAKELISLLDE